MTIYYHPLLGTVGKDENLIKLLIVSGSHDRRLEKKAITAGQKDIDYLIIKDTAAKINLSEEEAMDLIDKIRKDIPINK